MKLKIRAKRGDFSFDPDTIQLFMYGRHLSEHYVAKKILIEKTKRGEEEYVPLEPFMEIDYHQAQQLIDSLWDCGLRPSEGTGSAGAMAATERHLKDLKTILFNRLKIREGER